MTHTGESTAVSPPADGPAATPRSARLAGEFAAAVVAAVVVLAVVYLIFPRTDNYLSLKHRLVKHLSAGLCLLAAGWGIGATIRPGAGRRWQRAVVPLVALALALALGVRLYHPALNKQDRWHVSYNAGHERLWERHRRLAKAADSRAIYVAGLAAAFGGMIALNRTGRRAGSEAHGVGPAEFVAAALCFAAVAAVLNLQMPQPPALAFAEEAMEWNAAVALLFAARAGTLRPSSAADDPRRGFEPVHSGP